MSNISPVESEKLKKLAPAPTIPIDQLRAQIASFRHINTDTDKSWIYIVGGGSGSGLKGHRRKLKKKQYAAVP